MNSNVKSSFFRNINHAKRVVRDHKRSWLVWKRSTPESTLKMESNNWKVWFAPPPNDIIWQNLSNKRWTMVKQIIANLFIFVVAFFLTTPQFLVHLLDPIMIALKNQTSSHDERRSSVIDSVRWLTDIDTIIRAPIYYSIRII